MCFSYLLIHFWIFFHFLYRFVSNFLLIYFHLKNSHFHFWYSSCAVFSNSCLTVLLCNLCFIAKLPKYLGVGVCNDLQFAHDSLTPSINIFHFFSAMIMLKLNQDTILLWFSGFGVTTSLKSINSKNC